MENKKETSSHITPATNRKIIAIQLHVAQNITGEVRGHVSSEKARVTMTLVQDGVQIIGNRTNKLVPFGNIQGIDFEA